MQSTPIPAAAIATIAPGPRAVAQALLAAGARVERHCEPLDDGTLVVTGQVTDSDNATSRCWIAIDDAGFEGDCSCPQRRDCEHVAALLLADSAPRPQPCASDAEQTDRDTPAATAGAGSRARLALVLHCDAPGGAVFIDALRLAGRGGRARATPYALERATRDEQPAYIGARERQWLQWMHKRRCPQDSSTNRARLQRTDAASLLELAAATPVLIGAPHGPRLQAGEPVAAAAGWAALDDGSQRFDITPPDMAGYRVLPLRPPLLLDTGTGACRGTRVDGLAPADCDWLIALGVVTPDETESVVRQMDHRGIPAAVPRPARREIVRLPERTPAAVLILDRAPLADDPEQAHARTPPVVTNQPNNETTKRPNDEPTNHTRARLAFRYGDVLLEADPAHRTLLLDRHRVAQVRREPAAERAVWNRLDDLGLVEATELFSANPDDPRRYWIASEPHQQGETWLRVQQAVHWQIEYGPGFDYRLVVPERWYGVVDGQRDEAFRIELGAELEGRRYPLLDQLVAWLDAVPAEWLKSRLEHDTEIAGLLLRLDDTRIARMPAARLRAALTALIETIDTDTGQPVLPRARIGTLAGLDAQWALESPTGIMTALEDLGGDSRPAALDAPAGLNAVLRGYQRLGLAWLQALMRHGFGGVLADDMGLGKTLQILAHILTEQAAGRLDRPCLIVAPTSLLFNWRAEAARFAPGLRITTLHGPKRARAYGRLDRVDVALTSYALLTRDRERLQARNWHLVVLDEAQAIKNPGSQVARYAAGLEARQRICLSGTPLENHLGELWSLFHFAVPGLLGGARAFRQRFRVPIENHDDRLRLRALRQLVAPFLLRRTKQQAAPELPAVSEMERRVEMDEQQRELYETVRVAMQDKVRRAIERQGIEQSRVVVLDALLKLRQICCDPRLAGQLDPDGTVGSAKLELLVGMLPEALAEGRRVVLFSQFTSMLALIEAELNRMDIGFAKLTGRTRDRERPVRAFQRGEVAVFLVSLKAGGAGLNLTAADTVIHYDPWWNPAVEDQATGRAHRIGQTERVFSWRLITAGTVEERVVALQQQKRHLIESLFDQRGATTLGAETIEHLFAPLDAKA